MALLYSPSISNLFVFRGIMGGITGVNQTGMNYSAVPNPALAVTIYSGVQPSAATITSSWASYNSSYLFHQPGINYYMTIPYTVGAGAFMSRSNNPTAVIAANSGTASWCIIWCNNVAAGTSAGQIGNATIPNVNFIVGPVTIGSGIGIVTLNDLAITSGSSVTILDSTIEYRIP